MQHFNLCAAAAAALILSASAWAAPKDFEVNGIEVTAKEQQALIDAAVKRGVKNSPQLENSIRQSLIQEKVLEKAARDGKYDRLPEVKDAVRRTEIRLSIDAMVADWIKQNPVKDKEVKDAYDAMKRAYGDTEYDISRIVVKDLQTANKLIARINKPQKGDSFEKLARENSIVQAEKGKDGKIGWLSPANVDRQISSAFMSIKPGDVAQTPIRTAEGFSIIKLNGKRAAQNFPKFENEKDNIKAQLKRRKAGAHFAELVKSAKIED